MQKMNKKPAENPTGVKLQCDPSGEYERNVGFGKITMNQLLAKIDDAFWPKFLDSIHQNLSSLEIQGGLREIFQDFSWAKIIEQHVEMKIENLDLPLSDEELVSFLESVPRQMLQSIVEKHNLSSGDDDYLEQAFQILFNNSSINNFQAAGFEFFFTDFLLREVLFHKVGNEEELRAHERNKFFGKFKSKIQKLVFLIHRNGKNHPRKSFLLKALFLILQTENFEKAKVFIASLNWKRSMKHNSKLKKLESAIRRIFPEIAAVAENQQKVDSVLIGANNEALFAVAPKNNFYFHPDPPSSDDNIVLNTDDVINQNFPISGNRRDEINELVAEDPNISVFDAAGNKIFWGSLPKSAMEKLKGGPYYVLSSADSFINIPDWAVEGRANYFYLNYADPQVAGPPMHPPVEEPTQINPDYMRLVALGKTEGGKYVPNPVVDLKIEGEN